jgi:hypothetical protein
MSVKVGLVALACMLVVACGGRQPNLSIQKGNQEITLGEKKLSRGEAQHKQLRAEMQKQGLVKPADGRFEISPKDIEKLNSQDLFEKLSLIRALDKLFQEVAAHFRLALRIADENPTSIPIRSKKALQQLIDKAVLSRAEILQWRGTIESELANRGEFEDAP